MSPDELVARKVAAVANAGLSPIVCVGESAEVRNRGKAEQFVTGQLVEGLSRLSDISGLLVAYEPVWAIGSGRAATSTEAQEMAAALRSRLGDLYGAASEDIPCLYGGSVNPVNIAEFIEHPDIGGALVGGASLEADSFAGIVRAAAHANGP